MSKIEYQLKILEALQAKRAVQVRRRNSDPSLPNPWIKHATGEHLLNFAKFDYRIAPVTKAAWLVYDTKLDLYLSISYGTPVSAAFECNERNRTERGARYVPVEVKPCEP